jgi:putative SOS response-associated peptidase YedK
MCNLYRQRSTENLSRIFDALPLTEQPELKLDIYPKYDACVIRIEEGRRIVDVMSWGIITTIKGKSGKPIQKPVTNVRNLTSPFWRSTIANPAQRCLVPFTSFAEPRPGKDPETGRPANWWFTVAGEEVCAFAGIWRWSEGKKRFAFLTCEPNPLVAPLHPKAMPVILQPEDYESWLDGEAENACALAQPFPSQLMKVA